MVHVSVVAAIVVGLVAASPPVASAQTAPFCQPGQAPQFVLGFAALKAQVGPAMGDPIECEHANPENGDALQQTTAGLSFYRKSTNTPTFTDGYNHWGLTSGGMVTWTGDSIDPPDTAAAAPPIAPARSSAAPAPTPTSPPAAPPAPAPQAAAPRAEPVVITGRGQTATNAVTLPSPATVVTFTHNGSRNFIVKAFAGSSEQLLVNVIGGYRGQRPVFSNGPITFDIQADGDWTLRAEAIQAGGSAPFSGSGDAVSALFTPPASGPWEISHGGSRNFIVRLHCLSGTRLVQNQIGRVQSSGVVQFGQGPCLWEVQADGEWSLRPR